MEGVDMSDHDSSEKEKKKRRGPKPGKKKDKKDKDEKKDKQSSKTEKKEKKGPKGKAKAGSGKKRKRDDESSEEDSMGEWGKEVADGQGRCQVPLCKIMRFKKFNWCVRHKRLHDCLTYQSEAAVPSRKEEFAEKMAVQRSDTSLALALLSTMGWVPDHVWYAQKKGKGKGGGGGGGLMSVIQSLMGGGGGSWGKGGGKGKGNARGNMGMIGRTAKQDAGKVVWIGGLGDKIKDKEGNKKLKDHFEKLGAPLKFVNITSKGEGGAIFGSEAEAQVAIASVNGTKFMGKTLEVDVWTKKEK